MDYYKETQFIALVDEKDNIIGKEEKWKAHREGLLHRAFTTILTFENKYILQHRKHPVFDGYFDLSFSSHQIYVDDKLEEDLTAIYKSLKREWNIDKNGLASPPKKIGSIYYKARDEGSKFFDHEIDYIYKAELKQMPAPNYEFSYGFSVLTKEELLSEKPYSRIFAPWVSAIIKNNLL